MKPKFAASAKPTIEGMRVLVVAAYGKKLRMRMLASGLVVLLALGFVVWTGLKPLSLGILALALAFLWFFARSKSRMAEKLLAASPNQALVTEFRFMDDALYTHNSEEDGKILYPAITRVWSDRAHFAFYLEDGSAFVIPKAGFSEGEVDRFPGFVKKVTGRNVLEV
ncbi:MAG: YcxB family protein [Clostridiales bacterium]|jgi:hypothetical protein|nr:YcxB family protein [Clostridiales bacterium]OPZ68318.1 MAG: hypothetical protein BWY81_00888 [Firmicutes bacterium ADurb.Bin467]